jgi:hypothetical protein
MRSSGYATLATWRTRRSTTSRGPVLGRGRAATGVGACRSQREERTYSGRQARARTAPIRASSKLAVDVTYRPAQRHARSARVRSTRSNRMQTFGTCAKSADLARRRSHSCQRVACAPHSTERRVGARGQPGTGTAAIRPIEKHGATAATGVTLAPGAAAAAQTAQQGALPAASARREGHTYERRRADAYRTARRDCRMSLSDCECDVVRCSTNAGALAPITNPSAVPRAHSGRGSSPRVTTSDPAGIVVSRTG